MIPDYIESWIKYVNRKTERERGGGGGLTQSSVCTEIPWSNRSSAGPLEISAHNQTPPPPPQ